MSGLAANGGTGANLSLGPALAKLRKDNALAIADAPYDPEEDEPHIVGIPKKYQAVPSPALSEQPHS
jgi:hypothetical protein